MSAYRPFLGLAAVALVLIAPGFARAGFAIDTFSYPTGPIGGVGNNGGTGFSGAWSGTAEGNVSGGQLVLTGSNGNAASRTLAATVSSTVYFSYTVRFTGILNNDDFLALWFDTSATGNHTSVPNAGVRGNNTSDFYVRLSQPPNGEFLNKDLVAGVTYTLVGKLEKTGPGAAYNKITMWVDPASESSTSVFDVPPPSTGLTSFNTIGFRTANLATGDAFFVDNLQFGDTFASVTAPAPGGVALALTAVPFLAGVRRFRRPVASAAQA